jgi:hypothetical protein
VTRHRKRLRCTCGFRELPGQDIIAHLLAVFTPPDHKAPDGTVHEETWEPLTCACGLATGTRDQLHGHWLAVFTPHDHIGPDGILHETARRDSSR